MTVSSLYKSLSHDPWVNLALEEYFMQQVKLEEIIFYLWQNHNTVVIGRNQNAWKECRNAELESAGGKLARRLSGGGAVFHDLGNLNFSFIMHKEYYDLSKQLSVVLQAVQRLGMAAEFSGRNDLLIQGRKFSGNSYYFHKDIALHHGTLLINSDLNKLSAYLQVSPDKIISKGIDSVQSRVVNLAQINESINLAAVFQKLEQCFADIYGGNTREITVDRYSYNIEDLVRKYSSWEWRFSSTPQFDIAFNHRFTWGEIELGFTLKNGQLELVRIFSDALEEKLIRDIQQNLQGCWFQKDLLLERIRSSSTQSDDQEIINDMIHWLEKRDF